MRASVLGIDGCRNGWAIAALQNGAISFSITGHLDGLDLSGVSRIFIDIPIGLPETGQRTCDLRLRERLPARLKTSVFPCPVRVAVYAADYTVARRLSIEKTRKSMSIQAWNICPKIREADQWLEKYPHLNPLVFESHPEWNWLRLNGLPLASKHTVEGREQRRQLLLQRNIVAPQRLTTKNITAKSDDLLDAAILAHAAARSLQAGLHGIAGQHPDIWTWADD